MKRIPFATAWGGRDRNRNRSRSDLLLVGLVSALICSGCDTTGSQFAQITGSGDCSVVADGQMPLMEERGRMLTPVNIEGQPLMMLIDTGAGGSALSPQTAAALNEEVDSSKTVRVNGIGGQMDRQHPYILRSIRFGSLNLTDYDVLTVHIERPEAEHDGASAAGMVGLDLLSRFDVAFDFPEHRMSLYHVRSCAGRFVSWPGQFDSFKATRSPRGALIIPVVMNGVTLRALIDTGSNRSSMSRSAAAKAGVDEAAMVNDPVVTFTGANGSPMKGHRHRFDTMTVGSATFHNASVSVQEQEFPGTDMLLGMDFLRWRTVWLSYSTNQVFIQYIPHPKSNSVANQMPAPASSPGVNVNAGDQALSP